MKKETEKLVMWGAVLVVVYLVIATKCSNRP